MPGVSRRCLFGGALLAAGLMAPVASAQSFLFDYSASYVGILDVNTHESVARDYAYGTGFISVFASAGSSYAGADLAADRISNRASSRDPNYLTSGFHFFSYFQVSQDTLATVTWDFRADLSGPGSHLDIYAPDAQLMFSENDEGNAVGSAQIQLYASLVYHLEGSVFSQAGSKGTSFYEITVPAPGTGVILGALGVAASRRRRAGTSPASPGRVGLSGILFKRSCIARGYRLE